MAHLNLKSPLSPDDPPAIEPTAVQRTLPMHRQILWTPGHSNFAHPTENDLSNLLDRFGVRWAYEPTSFAINWADDGRPSEMFSPDFYLLDHRVYLELTTMRQTHVTRKNRKLRLLREYYPTVRIKLLYRRDYDRLIATSQGLHLPLALGAAFATEAVIKDRVDRLAIDIITHIRMLRGVDTPLVVELGAGVAKFSDLLGDALRRGGLPYEPHRIGLARYRTAAGQERLRISRGPKDVLVGRDVLVVTDAVSSGLTLAFLGDWLRRRGAGRVIVASLLDRRTARLVDLHPDFAAFEAPEAFVGGFGLNVGGHMLEIPGLVLVK